VKLFTGRSLRARIFGAFAAIILAVLLATLGLTQLMVGRDARQTLSRELHTTGQVFASLLEERAARLRSSSALLSGDFALKRVFATHFDPSSYDAQTLASAGLSYRERLGVQLVWMTDEAGMLLAASPDSTQLGKSLADFPPLRQALATESPAAEIVAVQGQLYQMVAVPVLGPDVIGYLLLGQIVNDAVAAQLKQNTHSDITFLTPAHVYASSWPVGAERSSLNSQLARLLQSLHSATPALLSTGSERYLSMALPVEAAAPQPLFVLIQGSYDRALQPLHALQWRIAAIGILALAAALITGMFLTGSITGPVGQLVGATREVLRGNLQTRARLDRSDELGFLASSFNEMVAGLQERERIKDTFGRFVSNDVAEAVLGGHVPLAGERLTVSILFQDIRGFSALSEKLRPEELLQLLNRFFTAAVAAVEAEGGVVKQFTGDGVMALFGVPQRHDDHAERAVRAALGIVRKLQVLNAELHEQATAALRIGIGVHTGEVVAGLIGPDQRVEYGVVGEPVNLASRIEGLTKEVVTTILVSKETASRLGPQFALGRCALLAVKGGSRPVEVVEVLVDRGTDAMHSAA
jgi:class 3 adenylate cyclase